MTCVVFLVFTFGNLLHVIEGSKIVNFIPASGLKITFFRLLFLHLKGLPFE